jgi:3-hydroxyisobutyrate dehydrogenase-like beta-hydroxyacid dehydrogenase
MTSSSSRAVGIIGAGRMGQPIIGHLARNGFGVIAYDVDATKRDAVVTRGGTWAESPAAVAKECDSVLICVGYDRQLRELVSPDGLLNALRRDAIIAVLSTVQPRTIQELAVVAVPFGVHLVDATMCRGGRAADEGTLLSFVGGPPDVVARLRPVLSCFATDIVPTGAIGTAQVAKAANNMVMWACLIANHEALALASRSGIDVEQLREALLQTGAENYVLRHWGTNTMAWAEDDLEIVQSMAHNAGLGLPQAGLNRELCRTLKPKRFRLDEYGV